MLELFFEVLIYTIPQATGRALVYVVTLGRLRCEDRLAEVIGVVFWLVVCLAVAVLLARPS
jgi:hypothetical protein